MSEEQVDFEALYDRVSEENRLLRMQLFKTSMGHTPSLSQVLERANAFVRENYLLIMVVLFVGSSIVGGLYTVWRDSRHE